MLKSNIDVFFVTSFLYSLKFLLFHPIEYPKRCPASPDGWVVWSAVVFTRWWLLVDHCVLRNWDRILVRAVKGLISRAGMVSICPLLWRRDVKLQQTKKPKRCQNSGKLPTGIPSNIFLVFLPVAKLSTPFPILKKYTANEICWRLLYLSVF